MKLFKLILLIVFCCLCVGDTQAQLFRRSRGYSTTENGYYYKGREYIRGRDLPDNPRCPCPMCRDLVAAYNAAKKNTKIKETSASTSLIGTPHDIVPKLVDVFMINSSDFVLLDPGCGDARILIDAVKRFDCRAVGIEINTETYKIALEQVKRAGLEDKITIRNGDSRDYSFKNVDGIVMFLFPDLISELANKFDELKPGTKVVSYSHDIPLENTIQCEDIYVWTKE